MRGCPNVFRLAAFSLFCGFVYGAAVPAKSDSPEDTMRNFLTAIFSNDKTGFDKTIIPNAQSGKMLTKPFVGDQKAAEIKQKVAAIKFIHGGPFTLMGKPAALDPAKEYPEGTQAIFQTQYDGTGLVIICLKRGGEWRVDLRWWLSAMQALKAGTPENSVKWFLLSQLTQQKPGLEKYAVQGADLKGIADLKAPASGDWDVIEGAIEAMGLVQPEPGEGFVLPDGKAYVVGKPVKDELFLVGIFGTEELAFQLKKIGDDWKVVPYDYLTPLRKKNVL